MKPRHHHLIFKQSRQPERKKLLISKQGQALIEYMIVITLVSITAVGVLKSLSSSLQNQIKKTSLHLQSLSKKTTSSGNSIDPNENNPAAPF